MSSRYITKAVRQCQPKEKTLAKSPGF